MPDLPDFFIIGAPKCGTTSLYRYLAYNSNIFFSAEKEPGFFCEDLPFRNVFTIERYRSLFADRGDAQVAGEASPWYLYSRVAIPRILDQQPNAKFVVMLRNPSQLAASLYYQHRHDGIEPAATFEAAWRAQRHVHLSQVEKRGEELPGFPYADVCALGSQLTNLFAHAARPQVKILILDDLAAHPDAILRDVSEFLGVPVSLPEDYPVHNASRVNRSDSLARAWRAATKRSSAYWLLKRLVNSVGLQPGRWLFERMITRETAYPAPPRWLREAMSERFADEVREVERLTGRQLSHWRTLDEAA